MIPWLSALKWLLQPKNALIVALALCVVGMAVALFFKVAALARATKHEATLATENVLYAETVAGMKANIEAIKKAAGKVQVIERNTHEVREVVRMVPHDVPIGGNCDTQDATKLREAAAGIVDYFNAPGLYPKGSGEAGTTLLPEANKTSTGEAGN